MYAGEQALGEGHLLVEVVEDLVQLLPDDGVLLDLGLDLVEQRGVYHGWRHLGCLGVGVVVVLVCCFSPMCEEWSLQLAQGSSQPGRDSVSTTNRNPV